MTNLANFRQHFIQGNLVHEKVFWHSSSPFKTISRFSHNVEALLIILFILPCSLYYVTIPHACLLGQYSNCYKTDICRPYFK